MPSTPTVRTQRTMDPARRLPLDAPCRRRRRRTPAAVIPALAGVALQLAGCGGGGGGGQPSAEKATTVIVMRHCFRSTGPGGIEANSSFSRYDDFSSNPWPEFGVPSMACLKRGESLVKAQGLWLKSHGGLPLPLRAVADLIPHDVGQRDNVTAHRLLEGLGLDPEALLRLDHLPFAPAETEGCQKARPSIEKVVESMQALLDAQPPPERYEALVEELMQVLGVGGAGNWTDHGCRAMSMSDDFAIPAGSCGVAAETTERLLMELGGGMEVGWGRLPPHRVPELLTLQAYHFYHWFAPRSMSSWQASSMAAEIADRLRAGEPGTTLYVGHDQDLMVLGGLLGLEWDAAPFPVNVTLPGSMLRFDRKGNEVSVSYAFVEDPRDDSGAMRSVPANFVSSGKNSMSLSDIDDLLDDNSVDACANSRRRRRRLGARESVAAPGAEDSEPSLPVVEEETKETKEATLTVV